MQSDVEIVCSNVNSNVHKGCVSGHDLLVNDSCAVIICPIAIAYSMGQIIRSVCVCVCVCVCVSVCLSVRVRLRALSRSHFLIDFRQNWHRVRTPKSKNEFVGGQYRTTPSPILPPQNPHFRTRGPENPCKY